MPREAGAGSCSSPKACLGRHYLGAILKLLLIKLVDFTKKKKERNDKQQLQSRRREKQISWQASPMQTHIHLPGNANCSPKPRKSGFALGSKESKRDLGVVC